MLTASVKGLVMKIDYRAVFVKMHAYLQMQENAKNRTVAEIAKSHRLLLENLVQQALTNEFVEESGRLQSGDPSILMKELLNGPCKLAEDLDT